MNEDINIDLLRKQITTFKNDVNTQRLQEYYNSKSYLEVLGVSRKEIPHSNFLSWLLNSKESHRLDLYPIKKILDILVLYSPKFISDKYKSLYGSIITDDLKIKSVEVETEKAIKGFGRLDIFVDIEIEDNDLVDNIFLVIENKVSAKETQEQTDRYYEYFESIKKEKTVILYVYLTPISTPKLMELEEAECSCKEFIQINYQSIVDLLIEPLLKTQLNDKTKFTLKEYLQALSQPSFEDEQEEYQEGLIMAVGQEERELLTKFWDNHQKLILATLYTISSDAEQDKDTRDSIDEALSQISTGSRDKSKLTIKYNNEVMYEKIQKADIGYKTVLTLESKGFIDSEIIEYLREDKSCSFNLLKEIHEVSDNEIKYRKYRIKKSPELIYESKEYYVARNWGINNMEIFIEKMQNKFPMISYEKIN